ncbi:MAG: response regulator [Treponemataceae bacterium]
MSSTEKLKVLVVEDEALISLMLCKELKKFGFDAVNKASTAEDAVRMVNEINPDFIFMDIRLIGHRDGIDAAETILAGRNEPIPIAFMTAYSSTEVKDRAMKLNPAAFLVKPVNVQSLRALIEREVGKAG